MGATNGQLYERDSHAPLHRMRRKRHHPRRDLQHAPQRVGRVRDARF